MSLHHIANHLASKGRNGDETLVHMTKGEVAGLQALAKAHGTTLTRNPHTGLPEAFSLKSLVPMAVGAGLMMVPGMQPLGAAAITGGLGYLATGSLQQGLMAGLGAYGGAGLAGTAGLGTAGTQSMAGQIGEAAATPVTEGMVASSPLPALEGTTAATTPFQASTATGNQALNYTGLPDASMMTSQAGYVPPQGSPINGLTETNVQAVGPVAPAYSAPASASAAAPGMGETFMKNAAANPWKTAGYGMAAVAPSLIQQPEDYRPPEIKSDADMGQRYAFESGYDNSIPGRTGPASYRQISNEEAKKLYGFAEGGEVQYPVGEPVMRMAEGGYTAQDAAVARGGLGLGIDYSGYDTMPNQGIAAMVNRGNPNQNVVDLYKAVEAKKAAEEAAAEASKNQDMLDRVKGSFSQDSFASGGGISTLGGYSDGGRLLKGPGDGMSDNIPARIGAKQPARLADGEFVVPADVVSHLGNGSTDAGAKQLYKMMDKVRTARTGRKAQGKQINPNKYVPA